ncbi:hypothetical protein DMH20_27615 [Escherichia coli]|nr:hypothetical protein [Escherichia coli]NYY79561.1 hypothetical protein [Escherichia coli]
MNYAGHENFAPTWRRWPTPCVTFGPLNDMEHRCRFDSDVLVERLTRQTLYRANRLFMEAYTEILELDSCFKD